MLYQLTVLITSPSVDHLNAAQTGATTAGLPDQVDYVLKYIGPRTRLINEWKMINLYIGYNDISSFCLPGMSPEKYGNEIYNNLKRLIDNTDNAFINVCKKSIKKKVIYSFFVKYLILIVTIERYDQLLMKISEHPDYVKQFADKMNIRNYECVCCANGGIEKIGAQVELYNNQLEIAVNRIKQYIDGTIVDQLLGLNRRNKIAIVLQPLDMNTATVPYDATR
jgi:phospholipase B1